MAPKRAAGDSLPLNSAARKRARFAQARTIDVPPSSSSSGHHHHHHYQGHGGSRASSGRQEDGTSTLPPVLEVEKFAAARAFEIAAMQKAMKSSKAAATQRAFQSLPRHLRRRAASHNIMLLPRALRLKARLETPLDAAKPTSRSRRLTHASHRSTRTSRTLSRSALLQLRQRKKKWLETHLWHAKRFHMADLWGWRLPVSPTAKGYRAARRAVRRGALVCDVGYESTFMLRGGKEELKEVLRRVTGDEREGKLLGGKRHEPGHRAKEFKLCVPVAPTAAAAGKGKEKEKEKEEIGTVLFLWCPSSSSSSSSSDSSRLLLIRSHPSISPLVFRALGDAVTGTGVSLWDRSGAYVGMEVWGPRAGEVLRGTLRAGNATEPVKKEALKALPPPLECPTGLVLSLTAHDPRLSTPSSSSSSVKSSSSSSKRLLEPSIPLAQNSTLWSFGQESDPFPPPPGPKAKLNKRREALLYPGAALSPSSEDMMMPVLILQLLSPQVDLSTTSSPPLLSDVGGYLILAPRGWGNALREGIGQQARWGGVRERGVIRREWKVREEPRSRREKRKERGREESRKVKEEREREGKKD